MVKGAKCMIISAKYMVLGAKYVAIGAKYEWTQDIENMFLIPGSLHSWGGNWRACWARWRTRGVLSSQFAELENEIDLVCVMSFDIF